MKKLWFAASLLLASCAPTLTAAPKPIAGEVIVEATLPTFTSVSDLFTGSNKALLGDTESIILLSLLPKGDEGLNNESRAGVKGITTVQDLFVKAYEDSSPAINYDTFYPFQRAKGGKSGGDSLKMLSQQGAPAHIQATWQATEINGKNTIDLVWETKPLGNKLLSVKVKASATDPAINTRTIEDRWMGEFLKNPGIKLIASGR
ncbi:hypothetical protein EHF33_02005 [Deinococcus psychrotolerans]|uniref:Lipoprotein n=1 Tax=Deinococcus psychrotolerans TaxID=2489213 RepID=A0A3G8Y9T6_9DEIO|nr:hypothetical protein [Deinococcus psychrotolerans]AZI41673.1 hypothetical protein EHF33_02005 [Deinococcus psychrotolerans]